MRQVKVLGNYEGGGEASGLYEKREESEQGP
jgi:hypothetical protein